MAASVPSLSIVIPCFNESEGIPAMRERLVEAWPALQAFGERELILIDDGSTDGTYALLQAAFADWPGVQIARHAQNQGLGQALRTGFGLATGAVIVSCDSDGTYPFHEIPALLAHLTSEVDLVTASPYHPDGGIENVPAYRIFISKCASLLYRMLVDRKIHTYTAMFRAYRREVIDNCPTSAPGFLMVTEQLVEAVLAGYRVAEYPAVLRVRRYGQSKARIVRITRSHLAYQRSLIMRRFFGQRRSVLARQPR